ncbi:MAG: hypothetical protein J0M02_13430, partial [Planctomycetes bacterium]|nr:hypothetical protein [Planctomycetota bacterium]
AAEAAPVATAQPPKALPLTDYLATISAPPKASPDAGAPLSADGLARMTLTEPGEFKPFQCYGNLAAEIAQRDGAAVLKLTLGQKNKEWAGGAWWNVPTPAGLKQADVAGIAFGFQGDGTMPREAFLTVKLKDGRSFKSNAQAKIFEDTAWREIVLRPADFAGKDGEPDLSQIARIDFSCVGPLFESRNTAQLGGFALLTRGAAEPRVERLAGRLPAPKALDKAVLTLPMVAEAVITADGDPSEEAWAKAVGFTMDEDAVPAWQKIGSHLAEGSRKQGEGARFWLLGTKSGLALVADVEKGEGAPVAGVKDWYTGDCVELFVDAKLERKKPSKQVFLAYRRPGSDRPASSAANTSIGRVRTARGYALEAVIPWSELGFAGVPAGEFGLDLQLDVGDADGRRLQLTYATGTNEAWITAERYLTVRIAP